ncbi:dystroglycan 1 [Hydra vulgaris]|uniref:dystroglycan 1 n=1 Tax=Hydra vulgaris TaxID=6087 RepID=UPI0001923B89|nr:dystroglycan 1 [Hydra vulgaris]XP_012555895.2 dystroglycan 1 [Hydra vulgaris]XP_047142067.1 dystroglycan 1 [Hydra vulgaris]XP_047142080.1 dystroglycan 1 [Hydra vulgaris]
MSNEVTMANKVVFIYLSLSFLPLAKLANEPTWKEIQTKLEQRMAEVFDDKLQLHSGEFFKYKISGEFPYEVDVQSSKELPKWLQFDSKKNKLQGVPTDEDIKNDLKIEFRKKSENSINGMDSEVRRLTIDVRPSREQRLFKCKDENMNPFIGSVIFYDDIKKMTGNKRVDIMREFASRLDTKPQDLYLEVGNRMDKIDVIEQTPQMAGPGDKDIGDKVPMFTISWVIHCGNDLAGSKPLALLRRLSEAQDFSSEFSVKVLGWLITSFKSHKLYKRAVGNSGNTVSILQATPTLLLPSLTTASAIKSVSPSPTTSIKIMMSTSVHSPKIRTEPDVLTTSDTITSKMPSPVTPKKPEVSNKRPELCNSIENIKLFAMSAFEIKVPVNLFNDPEKEELTISVNRMTKNNELKKLQPGHWVEYVDKNIYIFPGVENIGTHQFSLTATDPSGLFVNAMFLVTVEAKKNYSHIFNLRLDEDFSLFKSVQSRVELIKKLATKTKYELKDMQAIEILPGSVIINWAVDELNGCNNPQVISYFQLISSTQFKEFFYKVNSTNLVELANCSSPALASAESASGSLAARIIIPVIAIIIILILIAIILCCLYRRRQRYQPKDEDSYVRNHKKPVIFREEYEEKQPAFVSLQPLILPNEKPPVPTAYEPKLESQESSTESNGSDDRVFLTPGSPKDNGRKGYNAPPPYSTR